MATCQEVVCGPGSCQMREGRPVCLCPDGSPIEEGRCAVQVARHDIGINIDAPLDYNTNHYFADVMKTARRWTRPGTDVPLAADELDPRGWPKRDAECLVWHNSNMHGTYRLSFKGRAVVSLRLEGADGAQLLQQVYDPATDRTSALLRVVRPETVTFGLSLTETSGGVQDVKLMRPVSPGSSETYGEDALFTRAFKQAVEPFSTIRFMDFTATNWNQQKVWSDRVQPDAASFNRSADENGYGWQGRGAAWEYVVLMANELGKDAWINVPFWVDEDYIRRLAELLRDGNSHTRGLDKERKLYVEFSNEVWNYWQNENHRLAIEEVEQRGDPFRLNYDRKRRAEADDGWRWAFRRVGARIVQISRVFREVFGDDAMMDRIRPVLAWQAPRFATSFVPLRYIEEAYSEPVAHYLYGGGGSGYYSPDLHTPGLTLENLWESGCMNVDFWKETWPEGVGKCSQLFNSYLCSAYGIRRVAYEGGPSFDPDMPGGNDAVMAAAWSDPRIGLEVVEHQRAWDQWGGDLLVYFTLSRPEHPWAFARSVYDLGHPKYRALLELLSRLREPLATGAPVGVPLDGNAAQLSSNDWKDSPGRGARRVSSGEWVSYHYKVTQEGDFVAEASVSSDGPLWQVRFWADGLEVDTETSQPLREGKASTKIFQLKPGLRSIRLAAVGGGLAVKTVLLRER